MLKVAKNMASKGAEEAFARVEENFHLLGVNDALTMEMEALKAWLIEVEVFKEGAWAALKDAEERMVML